MRNSPSDPLSDDEPDDVPEISISGIGVGVFLCALNCLSTSGWCFSKKVHRSALTGSMVKKERGQVPPRSDAGGVFLNVCLPMQVLS